MNILCNNPNMRSLVVCCLFLLFLVALEAKADAAPTSFSSLTPVVEMGTTMTESTPALGFVSLRKMQRQQGITTRGVAYPIFHDPGFDIFLIAFPVAIGGILTITSLIGGLFALAKYQHHLGWGIANVIAAAGWLACSAILFAVGLGGFGALALLGVLLHGLLGGVNIRRHLMKQQAEKLNDYHGNGHDASVRTGLRLQSITPVGARFAF